MKKIIAFSLVAVMLVAACCACFVVNAEETDTATTFWLTHYGNDAFANEGAGIVVTESYSFETSWWTHVLFKPVAGSDAYEIAEITVGGGKAVSVTIPEGGFVYAINSGNNYPALAEQYPDEPAYKDKPNYVSASVTAMLQNVNTWKVGDKFVFSGLDLANKTVPTTTSDKQWYDPEYVCTATFSVAPTLIEMDATETVTLDGKLDDTGWAKASWIEKGLWQNRKEDDPTPEIKASYAVRSDADHIYIAIKVNQGAVFKEDNTSEDLSKWQQTGSTDFRIWLSGDKMKSEDGAEVRTFYDVILKADKTFTVYHEKAAPAAGKEMQFAADVSSDTMTTVELKLAKSAISATDSFKAMVTYSSPAIKDGKTDADGNEIEKYNAFHITEANEFADKWASNTLMYSTYSFKTAITPDEPAVDEVAKYTEEIAAKVGAVENAKGSVKLDSKLEGNKITVTLTIDDIAADAKTITGIAASLYFDADKVELDTSADNNPHAPSVGKIIKAPNLWNGEGYMTKPSEETANKIEVTIAGVPSKMGEAIPNLTKDDPVVLEFTFTLKDGAKMAGFWVTSESVIGYDMDVEPTGDAFQGGYTVAKTAVADTSSEASSSTSTAPKPGDTGIIVFAILGIVAVAGAAVVVKVRH